MGAPRVLITDSDLGEPLIERSILEAAGFELYEAQCRTEAEVIAAARGAVGLLVQYAPISAHVMTQLPELRAVVRYGAGLDGVDARAAARFGVAVSAVPDYCTEEVAEHTMGLILATTRGIVPAAAAVRAGKWPTADQFPAMRTVAGASLGLIGFGKIARSVAALARAFGMSVLAYDPFVDDVLFTSEGVQRVDFAGGMAADIVSLHVPLTAETAGIVDSRALATMCEDSVLVNVSRGGLVDEAALLESLSRGRPAFAALDVLSVEPAATGNPLVAHPRVILTPHIAFYSPSSLSTLRTQGARRLVELLCPNGAAR